MTIYMFFGIIKSVYKIIFSMTYVFADFYHLNHYCIYCLLYIMHDLYLDVKTNQCYIIYISHEGPHFCCAFI